LFAKALASAADALSFDLEDSVTPDRKQAARETLRDWLAALPAAQAQAKRLIVRVNALDTEYFDADIDAVVRSGVALINLPKPESADDVRRAAVRIERAERANGVTTPVRLLLNIESPRALLCAVELASAHPRVAGLQLGLGDLFEPLGVARRETAAISQAMFSLRMAAGAAGVFAYDAAFANIRDEAGFRAEAQLAKALGFLGKSCIHPSQIALANDIFRPSDDEIAHAVRVLDASRAARRDGVGAYVVDGKMIDAPFLERARALVGDAERMGLLSDAQREVLATV
jgi:citrate lyase subunit beta/citryl-CoA lyase